MGGRVESQALLAWQVGIVKVVRRQGTSDRRDGWSNNKMLTEAVDMTRWLAESVDWMSHVRRMATKTPGMEWGMYCMNFQCC